MINEINDEFCALWESVCNIESPTVYKEGVDTVGRVLAELARERGWLVEETESQTAGHAICITMNPEAEAEPVAFSGHMDTVHPVGLSRLGMISGKGSSDAGYITQAGIPCVDCLGVEGGDLHNIGEYALLDSLAASVKRLAAVAYCIE